MLKSKTTMYRNKPFNKIAKLPNKVFSSFVFALFLSLAIPHKYALYNPLWMVLLLIYWHIKLEFKDKSILLYYSFGLGLLCDIIFVKPLGLTAITYLFISYVLIVLKPKIYFYTLLQIFILISFMLFINQIGLVLYSGYNGTIANVTKIKFIAPVVLSLLLWPFLGIILDNFLLKNK